MAQASRALADMHAVGALTPLIGGDFAFEDIPEALHQLSRGEIRGKAVVLLGDGA
ncbi:MAG: hypothetical protein EPN99_17255 [Frankiales bacterium]|nr:MAG: hypothetical protein EPN99_17255 [Frankiales bacterium]